MLTQLTIANFGLIDKACIEFTDSLNVLTGETGAGKSILIDALRASLGERLENASIRDPKEAILIETIFDITDPLLRQHETITEFLTSDESQLIIQRSHRADGKNKIKINGLSVTLGQLKNIGKILIDFHGPHDHQLLFNEDEHIKILDKLVEFKNIDHEYTTAFDTYSKILKELNTLKSLSHTHQRDLELLTHEVKELEHVPLSEEKYQELLSEEAKLNNAQKLHDHIQNLLRFLDQEDTGVNTLLSKSFSPLKSLTQIDDGALKHLEALTSIQEQTNDLIGQLSSYADSLEFDDQRAQEIIRSSDAYSDILRKFGPSLADAQIYYNQAKSKLDLIKNFEHNDRELREVLHTKEEIAKKLAVKMTKARQKAGIELKETIEKELKELGINHVSFEVRFEQCPLNEQGQDKIIFYLSPNAGEDLKPLHQIASSGEAARLMLALKKALIKVDPIPVLIFDEIDAQIGGRLGTVTGKKLKELSKYRQVILITHLPQIASFANKHFKVTKSVLKGRTTTLVTDLNKEQRVQEIAQMLSGQDVNKISLSHAQDMLNIGQRKS